MVKMPERFNISAVFCPIPHNLVMDRADKVSETLSSERAKNPSGLPRLVAILARNLLDAIPTETGKFSSLLTLVLIFWAITSADPNNDLHPVTSKKASSILKGSIRGVYSLHIWKNCREARV